MNDVSTGSLANVTPAAPPLDVGDEAPVTKVSAEKVSVFYGDKQALFDVSIDIPERSVTALIGPSGCG